MSPSSGMPFRQSEGFYQHLFDSAPDVLLTIDRAGEIRVANSRCRDLLGYSPGEMEGQPVQEFLDGEERSAFEVMLAGLREGTAMPESEAAVRTRDGKPIPMMLDVRPIEGVEGDPFMVRLRDLREIRSLEQEYRNLFESIANAIFIGDAESGQILQANRQACTLTGYALGELLGTDYGGVHSESWETVRQEAARSGEAGLRGREMRLRRKDGQAVPVETHLRIVSRDGDRIYIETAVDISPRKALEARMKDLRAEWDSFVRHELRNPLTPILAFSQLLIEDVPEVQNLPKVRRYLEAIWQGGRRLDRLLDLTGEVQAYERGQILLQCSDVDLYPTVRGAMLDAVLGIGLSEADLPERILLVPHAAEGTALRVWHDPQKIQRAVANLIKNALEHDSGQVTVRVSDLDASVSVGVHNGGKPIPEDRLRTIFEKFNTTKRDRKGMGLGTTIARLFVRAHGGQITVASSEAEGTTFTVTLPKRDGAGDAQAGR